MRIIIFEYNKRCINATKSGLTDVFGSIIYCVTTAAIGKLFRFEV